MPAGLPSLNALRCFEAAARHLSFKLAAAELSVTPTAVSHQIRELEAWFGLPLFIRGTRRLDLSPAGITLFPKVHEGISRLVEAVEATHAVTPKVDLTVTAPPTFASRWLVPRLGGYTDRHRDDVVLHLNSTLETIDDSRREGLQLTAHHPSRPGEFDVEIRYGLGVAVTPGYLVEPFLATEYVLVCASAMLEGPDALRQPSDIQRCVLIHDDSLPDERMRPRWQDWSARGGFRLAIDEGAPGPRFNDTGMVLAAVANGMGVALMARQLIGPDLAEGRIAAPFDIAVPGMFRFYMVMREGIAGRAVIREFRDWIKGEAGRRPQRGAGRARRKPAEGG